jgi:uncharacterized protein YcaQ
MHELSRQDARRIAVRAQALDRGRPGDLREVVRRLTLLQIDPVAAVAPNVDLVAWSRLGSAYSPSELTAALDKGTLLELRAMIRPAEDIALYRADMARWDQAEPGELLGWRRSIRDWVRANDLCRRDILYRLEGEGPLPSRALPDTCAVPWKSSGWTNDRNVAQLLEMMVLRGEVAVAGRSGGDRLWDLAERVYPDDPVVPAAKRRWGYFALPILHGDRLVGKLDATADRKAGVLRVDAIHEDAPFPKRLTAEVRAEIEDLARWLQLDLALPR